MLWQPFLFTTCVCLFLQQVSITGYHEEVCYAGFIMIFSLNVCTNLVMRDYLCKQWVFLLIYTLWPFSQVLVTSCNSSSMFSWSSDLRNCALMQPGSLICHALKVRSQQVHGWLVLSGKLSRWWGNWFPWVLNCEHWIIFHDEGHLHAPSGSSFFFFPILKCTFWA